MGTGAADCFYRAYFPNEHSFWQWSERVVELAAIVRDAFIDISQLRAVIFVPQWPTPGAPLCAYVSAGARGLALQMSAGALIDRSTVISAAELPPGLMMLLGGEVDEAEYEKRNAWRRRVRAGVS